MPRPRRMRFEMPYTLDAPRLARPELGIEQVRVRGGRHSFTMDITLLDTPDNRLLRAGVVLAHRVVDGLGEWYLDAPGWQPWLPAERVEPMGAAGDLPDEFASLVRPFRRSTPLGPIAALGCKRVEWRLLGPDGEELALLRDDRLTIRRGGVTIGRHREVTLSPREVMTGDQRSAIAELLVASGGAVVDAFPGLTERLGAPATGLTDFGAPREWRDDFTLEGFVCWLFSRRLTKVMRADLALRSSTLPGETGDVEPLRRQLAGLSRELRGLSFVLDPRWLEQVEANLEVVEASLAHGSVHRLGDEYFHVLDALVLAVRAPRLGDHSQHPAAQELRAQMVSGATILFDRARSLTLSSSDERWAAALASARQLEAVLRLATLLVGKKARRASRRLDHAITLLEAAQAVDVEAPIDQSWTVVEAFEAGRAVERRLADRDAAREHFLALWPRIEDQLAVIRRRK